MDLDELVARWPDLHPYQCAEALARISEEQNRTALDLSDATGVASHSMISRLIRAYRRSCEEVRAAWQREEVPSTWVYGAMRWPHDRQRAELKKRLCAKGKPRSYGRPPISQVRKLAESLEPRDDYGRGVQDGLLFVLGERDEPV